MCRHHSQCRLFRLWYGAQCEFFWRWHSELLAGLKDHFEARDLVIRSSVENFHEVCWSERPRCQCWHVRLCVNVLPLLWRSGKVLPCRSQPPFSRWFWWSPWACITAHDCEQSASLKASLYILPWQTQKEIWLAAALGTAAASSLLPKIRMWTRPISSIGNHWRGTSMWFFRESLTPLRI